MENRKDKGPGIHGSEEWAWGCVGPVGMDPGMPGEPRETARTMSRGPGGGTGSWCTDWVGGCGLGNTESKAIGFFFRFRPLLVRSLKIAHLKN